MNYFLVLTEFFEFCHQVFYEGSLSSCENSDMDICSDRELSNLEYAVDLVRFNEDPINLGTFHDCVNRSKTR